ncbi:MAG TPA: hypothetical protein VFK50_04690 [Sphingomicrobium sp.]|nr:hypothetical protein [Sphingomicrobium sp.]
MPAQLPSQAVDHIPDPAARAIIEHGGVETYATVDFVGQSTNPDARGPIVEVDENSWIEANTWFFEEVSETDDRVVLFDESRGVTLIIDYTTDLIHVIDSAGNPVYDYDVTGVTYSLEPIETYATVDFVGQSTNPDAVGPIVEVDENSWVEANSWFFEEVSETDEEVVLFDESRGVTLIIDYTTDLIHVIDSEGNPVYDYDVTGVTYSTVPVIPDGWII